MAVRLPILTFTKTKSNISIHLKIDNKTALTYVLKMGVNLNKHLLEISN